MEDFRYFEDLQTKTSQYREKYGNMLIPILNETGEYKLNSLEDLDLEQNKLINTIYKFQIENKEVKEFEIYERDYRLLRYYFELNQIRSGMIPQDVVLDKLMTQFGELNLVLKNKL